MSAPRDQSVSISHFSRLRSCAWRAGVAVVFATVSPTPLAAQGTTAPTASSETSATSTGPGAPDGDDEPAVEETVVTGKRPQIGVVVGDIKPELQLGRTAVQSYGVGTVTELLNELAPQIRSDRGRAAEGSIILLNGHRISGMNEVRDIPTEAIRRVDILPEEVALKYGYAPGQRVVNVVLRRRFRAMSGEIQGGAATEGGRLSGRAQINFLRVRGENRINFDLKYQDVTAVTEAQRDLAPLPDTRAFDLVGNVVSPVPGAQIDPSLSALAGRPVTIAGVPSRVGGSVLTLADFAGTAGVPNASDVRRFSTLSPATRQVSANAVLARALPGGFSATLNASLSASRSESLEGLVGVRLLVPAGDPFSPFGSDVEVDRYASGLGPSRRITDEWTGRLAGDLNRDVGRWRLSLIGGYDHADTQTHTDSGADAAPLQALLLQGSTSFDPFQGELSVARRPADEARSRSDAIDLHLLANGLLLSTPTGPIYASFKLGAAESWLSSRSVRSDAIQSSNLTRNDLSARASFDIPVAGRSDHRAAIGELWFNVNAAVDEVSHFGTLKTVGYGLNWTPRAGINLIVSRTDEAAAPSIQQLGDPIVVDKTHVLDFVTGRIVDIRRVEGGNPALLAESRRVVKVGLQLRPFAGKNLMLSANYIDARTSNPIETFPAATTALQTAFPDRFLRDSAGQLSEIDYRPVNFALERRRALRWGFNYSRPFGSAPAANGDSSLPGRPRSAFVGGGRLQFAAYHTVTFEDDLLVRPGGPLLDLLNGAPAGLSGGQPRHEIEAQAGVTRNGLGARLSADWRSGASIRDASGSPTGDLTFSDIAKFDIRLFANFDGQRGLVERRPWLRGSRLTLSLANVFDQRVRVHDANGLTPLSYQPARLDPVGRVIRLSFRKVLY